MWTIILVITHTALGQGGEKDKLIEKTFFFFNIYLKTKNIYKVNKVL